MKPLISVVITTYNRPQELAETLHALRLQSFKSFEVVVVNDGGCDVESFIPKNLNYPFRLIQSSENGGISQARNRVYPILQGEYILTLDDDDLLLPTHLENLVNEVADSDLIFSDAEIVLLKKQNGKRICQSRQLFAHEFNLEILKNWLTIIPSGMMYKKKLHEQFGGFDETQFQVRYWDWDWMLRIAPSCKIKRIAQATVLYTFDADGQNDSAIPETMAPALKDLIQKHRLPSEVYPTNFLKMATDPKLAPYRQESKLIWDGNDFWSF